MTNLYSTSNNLFAEVAVARPLGGTLTYSIPAILINQVEIGHVVLVPMYCMPQIDSGNKAGTDCQYCNGKICGVACFPNLATQCCRINKGSLVQECAP